jgi:hypothetical protein
MNTTTTPLPIGPLYHGTREHRARNILRTGFRRAPDCSYTGTGICLSESLTLAYEYGEYEWGGCVLEAWLAPDTRWTDRIDEEGGRATKFHAWDQFFVRSGMDAVSSYGGNVWVLWNPSVVVGVRRLSHREALRLMCAAFEKDGPDRGYNGIAYGYSSLWWGQEAENPNLSRSPEDCHELRQRLERFVGRSRSERAPATAGPMPP